MPHGLRDAALAAFDYDGTIANTFAPSPRGIGVREAYAHALQQLFGDGDILRLVGGLRNRAPTELVRDIIAAEPKLLAPARIAYERSHSRLANLLPNGAGIPLSPLACADPIELIGEALVRLKLEVLLGEVSASWPLPFDGVLDFMDALRARGFVLAIVSSGHDPFIRRWFQIQERECPHILVTDDDMRPQQLPIEQKTKPSRVLLDSVAAKAKALGYALRLERAVYFGDDPVKDGGLARNASVRFGLFRPNGSACGASLGVRDFVFASWRDVPELFS